uniref:Replicase n=1 Tax=Shallot virus X TaxID=31770 RepID=L7VK41_SHVX|nr:replicase [Shallot virus X]
MTAVQKLFDQISDPNTKAGYSNACFEAAQAASKKATAIAPFSVTNPEALTLERLGITTSPFATTSHTHAADKIIENDCLTIIGHYLPKREAVTLIQLKRSKIHLLGRQPSQDNFQNYCHEPKDVLRYGITHPNSCPVVNTEYAVLADTLHFMSPRQLYHLFSRNPKLERLFATLVLPIEAQHRLPSLFPDVYRLEYYNDHFAYMPGGHGGGAYVHSYGTLKWLDTAQVGPVDYTKSSITNPWPITDYLSIEKIETKAAHHIMFIQRRRAQVDWPLPPIWVYHASEYVKLPLIFYPPEANVQKTYPHTLIKRMQLYCFSVKAVSLRDIFAKLRQVIETQELVRYSMADLIRLANYFLFITGMNQVSDYESPLLENLFGKMCASIRMRLRTFFQNLLGKTSYAALLTVTDVIPVHFTTQPKRREAVGELWFQEPKSESKHDDPTPKRTSPSPDDLDLLAWFHQLESSGSMSEPCNNSESTPQPHGNQPTEGGQVNDLAETQQADGPNDDEPTIPPADVDDCADDASTFSDEEDDCDSMPALEEISDLDLDDVDDLPNEASNEPPSANEQTPDNRVETTTRGVFSCECGTEITVNSFGRAIEVAGVNLTDHMKGRLAAFYSRDGQGYSYTGYSHKSQGWLDGLDKLIKACGEETTTYNQCLVQKYEQGSRIGFHSDDEAIYPKGNKILTVNAAGSGTFGIKCAKGETTLNLEDGDYFLMPSGFQETHKHNVVAVTPRLSFTFRSTVVNSQRKPAEPEKLNQNNACPKPSDPSNTSGKQHKKTRPAKSNEKSSSPNLEPLDAPTVEILKLHGFTALTPQHDGTCQIRPVYFNKDIHLRRKAVKTDMSPPARPFFDLATSLHRGIYTHKIDNRRATAYMSDVKNNLTGLVLPKLDRDLLSSWVALAETTTREVAVLAIHGAGGAGKSRALQELLRSSPELADSINIVVPTINLANDWKAKLPQMDPRRVMTFEKACERECKSVTIFDDYGKLPAGFVDAYLAIKVNVELAILTGDQRQSTHHQERESQISSLQSNIAQFSKYADYYLNATHRQPRRLANPIKVHAERQLGGAVLKANIVPDLAMVLVPAFRSQSLLTDLGRHAMTYAGCQGLTLNHLTIILDKDTPLCSDEVLYTAFSRASESITFVNTHSDNPAFLAKLDATPYLKTLISWVREDEQAGADCPATEPHVEDVPTKTHIPVANDKVQLEGKIEAMEDKDTRELWSGEEKTNLMQTQDPVVQLFPHQQAKDEALFKITIGERIRMATPEQNIKQLRHTLNAGDLLFEAYAQFMKVPKETQPFDKRLWTHCRQLALRTYLSKPTSNLQQGATRQDPDFPDNAIALFNKSQWVKKLEKVGARFKAGQTISAFKQEVVLLTTTMALYLRKKREQHQPDNVFIMCERTPEQFNAFVMTKWDFDRPNYTSDYTQYDQSQDAAFLNFEIRKARHLGVPEDVLSFYKFIKTHAKTFLGNLAIMRLSGEGPTFDANTECNIAYDALRFRLGDDVRACYAGDDLVRDKACEERAGWVYSESLFSLKAKPLVTNKPDFCGWRLTRHGIVKSPIQLYQSLQLALRLGKIDEVKRSYAIDYLFAYRLGDKIYDIFDEDELEKHQLVTRTLIKKGMQPPESGNHLPIFHITSDRLIRDPDAVKVQSYECDRILLKQPHIIDDYIPAGTQPRNTEHPASADRRDMTSACNLSAEKLAFGGNTINHLFRTSWEGHSPPSN